MDMPTRAGWYDDPENDQQLRYFDGVVWSKHTTPRSTRPSAAAAQPGQQQFPGQGHAPQYPGQVQAQPTQQAPGYAAPQAPGAGSPPPGPPGVPPQAPPGPSRAAGSSRDSSTRDRTSSSRVPPSRAAGAPRVTRPCSRCRPRLTASPWPAMGDALARSPSTSS